MEEAGAEVNERRAGLNPLDILRLRYEWKPS